MTNQVYRLDPDTGVVRVVADGFDKPNGIAFTADGKTAYMYVFTALLEPDLMSFSADTGALGAHFGNNQTKPATM